MAEDYETSDQYLDFDLGTSREVTQLCLSWYYKTWPSDIQYGATSVRIDTANSANGPWTNGTTYDNSTGMDIAGSYTCTCNLVITITIAIAITTITITINITITIIIITISGSMNQMSRQAGTCDRVRAALAKAKYSDVTMAPAADMFDQGVKLQVLKTNTMFPARAKKLFDLFCRFNSLEELPPREVAKLEKSTFKKPISEVWAETVNFYRNRLGDHEKIANAERDPKLKMSLVFRWYLSKSSGWANRGDSDRVMDYQVHTHTRTHAHTCTKRMHKTQTDRTDTHTRTRTQVWCGPAIGAFNEFIRGSILDPLVANAYPCVTQINLQLLHGACYLARLSQLSACFRGSSFHEFQGAYCISSLI